MGKKIINKERVYGLDLIRCLAFLFVVTFHSFLNNGHSYVEQIGATVWIADTFRFLSISCIGLYLMLSGYLKCENTDIKSCYRGIVSVLDTCWRVLFVFLCDTLCLTRCIPLVTG